MEDSDADFVIMELALQEYSPSFRLSRLSDGEQAIRFFQRLTDQLWPDLVFLDVNMPRLNGFDVLQFIRTVRSARDIPVVMFTTSYDVRDKKRALEYGAQDFITKPQSFDRTIEIVTAVCTKYLHKRLDQS